MKEGKLFYDGSIDRMDICFGHGDYYGGLHCGQVFEVKIGGAWETVRIEKGNDWYLVGRGDIDLWGLPARI